MLPIVYVATDGIRKNRAAFSVKIGDNVSRKKAVTGRKSHLLTRKKREKKHAGIRYRAAFSVKIGDAVSRKASSKPVILQEAKPFAQNGILQKRVENEKKCIPLPGARAAFSVKIGDAVSRKSSSKPIILQEAKPFAQNGILQKRVENEKNVFP